MKKYIKIREFWFIVILLLLLLLLVKRFQSEADSNFIERAAAAFFAPAQRLAVMLTENLENWNYLVMNKKDLEKNMAQLLAERNQLKLENQQLREYEAEVKRLQKLLGLKESQPLQNLLGAKIIARSPDNWKEFITIDQGEAQGIRKNMAVINSDGLIGVVSSVTAHSARVSLLTDTSIAVGVVLEQSRETNGIVEGIGINEQLRLKDIPYYSSIQLGERVLTSGLSQIYPKGITVGTVAEVTREENGLLLSALVAPAVRFNELEEVIVVLDYQNATGIEANE